MSVRPWLADTMLAAVRAATIAHVATILVGTLTLAVDSAVAIPVSCCGLALTFLGVRATCGTAASDVPAWLQLIALLCWTAASTACAAAVASLDGLDEAAVIGVALALGGFTMHSAAWAIRPDLAAAQTGRDMATLSAVVVAWGVVVVLDRPVWRWADVGAVVGGGLASAYLSRGLNAVAASKELATWREGVGYMTVWWLLQVETMLRRLY